MCTLLWATGCKSLDKFIDSISPNLQGSLYLSLDPVAFVQWMNPDNPVYFVNGFLMWIFMFVQSRDCSVNLAARMDYCIY